MHSSELPSPIAEAFEAFNNSDPDGVVADFADGATFYDPAQDESLSRTEHREYCAELFEAFPDGRLHVDRIVSNGGTTAIEWQYTGTFQSEIEGVPPTGESFELPGISIITVEDSTIIRWRDYWDQQAFFDQVGLTFPTVLKHLPGLISAKVRDVV